MVQRFTANARDGLPASSLGPAGAALRPLETAFKCVTFRDPWRWVGRVDGWGLGGLGTFLLMLKTPSSFFPGPGTRSILGASSVAILEENPKRVLFFTA